MGVSYKINQEIVTYIVTSRTENPQLSLRELGERIEAAFGVHISKSSIHEILKEANITSTRGRKPKEGFKIPTEKKQQILSQLPPVQTVLPQTPYKEQKVEEPQVVATPVPITIEPTPPLEIRVPLRRGEYQLDVKDIFLKAAFWDLRPEKALGIATFNDLNALPANSLTLNWDYITQPATAIRLRFANRTEAYIDGRFQGLTSQLNTSFPAPLERLIKEAADYVVNNIRPLCLGDAENAALELLIEHNIVEITIVDHLDHIIVNFTNLVDFKRNFIVKTANQVVDLSKNVRLIKNDEKFIVSNLLPIVSDQKITEKWLERFSVLIPFNPSFGKKVDIRSLQWLQAIDQWSQKAFFQDQISPLALDPIPGYEESNNELFIVHLEIASSHPQYQLLTQAATAINALYIHDEANRKITLEIDPLPS